jgi:hypothetical protein
MNNSICPICGQAGLPDYKTRHTTCPQCNSDLKAYLLLNSIQKKTRSKSNIVLLSILGMCIIISVFYIFYNIHTQNKVLENYGLKFKTLEDSLCNYRNGKSTIKNLNNELIYKYKIRKGDCPWKIAVIFYGNGQKYKLIEQENNLQKPYKLKIGQQIKIKLNQE